MKFLLAFVVIVFTQSGSARDCSKEICVESPEEQPAALSESPKPAAPSQVEIECCYNYTPETASVGGESGAGESSTTR